MSSQETSVISIRLRGRDKELMEELKSVGVSPAKIFRLGILRAYHKRFVVNLSASEDKAAAWRELAVNAIVGDLDE